jgi:hypothetical protein
MKKIFLFLGLLVSITPLRSQSLTFSITASNCFNSSSASSNTAAASVTSNTTSATNYVWSITSYPTNSACVGTYTASNSTGSSVVISYPCCGSYSVACAAMNGTAVAALNSSIITVNCSNVNIYAPNGLASCSGSSVLIIASGGSSYSWTDGTSTISTTGTLAVTPTASTCYTVAGTTTAGCAYSSVSCVTVAVSPTVSISGVSSTTANCQYSNYTMTATGATNYTWIPTWLGNDSTAVGYLGGWPCYTVIGSNGSACTTTATICPSVTPSPTVNITASPSTTVCAGTTVTLASTSGPSSYSWATNSGALGNGASVAVTPTSSSWNIYTLTVTYPNGCSTWTYVNLSIATSSAPSVIVQGGAQFCSGQTKTLYTSSSGPWSWSDGNSVISTSSLVTITPTASSCYTLSASTLTCAANAVVCLTLVSPPTLTVTGSQGCSGLGAGLYAQGATFYSIPTQSISSGYFYVNPTSSSCYTVTGWNISGCTSTAVACVTVVPPPVYTGTSSIQNICLGQSPVLATSSTSHAWNLYSQNVYLGTTTGTALAVTPTANTVYSVTVDGAPCYSGFTTTVTVSQAVVSISGNNTVCAGGSLNLSASGGTSYVWSNSSTGANITVNPLASGCFTVTGTNSSGCSATAVHCVTVAPAPSLVGPSSATVCEGTSHTFTVSGASGYLWSTAATTNTLNVMPSVSTSYTITGTGSNGCSASAIVTLVVDTTCTDVWPGDANSDGVVGTSDVLEIGLAYNATGNARTPGGNNYVAQQASNWNGTVSSGKNKCHADCNGDGTIDDDDTLAIYTNFAQTHAFRSSTGTDVRVVSDQNYFTAGTWNKVDIYSGDGQTNILLYGLTFDLGFDNTLVENDAAYLVYTSSFLNNGNQNVEFRKQDFASGKVFAATVRTDHANVSGTGKIGEFHFKVKPGTEGQFMTVSASNSERVDKDGNFSSQAGNNISVEIRLDDVGMREESRLNGLSLIPNPAFESVTIKVAGTKACKYVVSDISGRIMFRGEFAGATKLNTSELSAGVYLITCSTDELSSSERLIITK